MWRGVSLRKLALLLIGPLIVEAVSTLIPMWMLMQTVATGYEPRAQMLIASLGAAGYATSAFIAGKWVTPATAPRLMLASIVLAVCSGLLAFAFPMYGAFLVIAPMMGACIGHYYVPFQINMAHVKPFHTLAWSVALYNMAWGSGASLGPFMGTWFREQPVLLLGSIAAGLMLVHTLLCILERAAPAPIAPMHPTPAFTSTARQRLNAWLCFFAVNISIRGLYSTLWPYLAKSHGWSDQRTAIGLLAMWAPVPLAAPLWAKLRHRLHEPWIMLASMMLGVSGFVALPLVDTFGWAIACLVLVGVAESCTVFHMVFYANADASTQIRSVGISETLAGCCFVLGPTTAGLLAWDATVSWRPYAFCVTLLCVMMLTVALRRIKLGPNRG
ncbi:MAG: MFS transporter [Planctomycetes bacterium]|nr:MFS transporter [Planctomycetota bacterium]